MRRLALFMVLAVYALLAGAQDAGQTKAVAPKGLMPLDGRAAPALRLKSLEGKTTDLAQLRGRWVMVHFWASWCGPCRREMPTLGQLKEALQGQPFEVLLINTAEDEDTVFSFLGQVAPDLDSLLDPDGRATDLWQPRGLPASFFVDPAGRLRWLALGGRAWNEAVYQAFVRSLLAGAPLSLNHLPDRG